MRKLSLIHAAGLYRSRIWFKGWIAAGSIFFGHHRGLSESALSVMTAPPKKMSFLVPTVLWLLGFFSVMALASRGKISTIMTIFSVGYLFLLPSLLIAAFVYNLFVYPAKYRLWDQKVAAPTVLKVEIYINLEKHLTVNNALLIRFKLWSRDVEKLRRRGCPHRPLKSQSSPVRFPAEKQVHLEVMRLVVHGNIYWVARSFGVRLELERHGNCQREGLYGVLVGNVDLRKHSKRRARGSLPAFVAT